MDAKELRDEIATKPGAYVVSHPEHQSTILRALDLLAAVEGSQDEIVRELNEKVCGDYEGSPCELRTSSCTCRKAAAALVAERAAKEKAEGERDEIKRHAEFNANTRATVDYLLAQAGFAPDSSVRNLLACMNFDSAAHPEKPAQYIGGDCIASEVAHPKEGA